MVPEVQGKTESFQGRTVPRFPEMSEDVALPGVRSGSGPRTAARRQLTAAACCCPFPARPPCRRLLAAVPALVLPGWLLLKANQRGEHLCPACGARSTSAALLPAQVYELMNLAYNLHEIISDYFTPSLMWLENGWVEGGAGKEAGRAAGAWAACTPPDSTAARQHTPF